MKALGMMHYIIGMEVWTREVCNRDPEEVQDYGVQGHDHTYGIKPEAIECFFVRDGCCHDVSSNDLFLDVPKKYENRYLLCFDHIEAVPDGLKTCSPYCCKAYLEVPKGCS